MEDLFQRISSLLLHVIPTGGKLYVKVGPRSLIASFSPLPLGLFKPRRDSFGGLTDLEPMLGSAGEAA